MGAYCVYVCVYSAVSDSLQPQAPLSMEFPRQESWNRLSFPPLGHLPNPWIKPVSPLSWIGRWVLYHCTT